MEKVWMHQLFASSRIMGNIEKSKGDDYFIKALWIVRILKGWIMEISIEFVVIILIFVLFLKGSLPSR